MSKPFVNVLPPGFDEPVELERMAALAIRMYARRRSCDHSSRSNIATSAASRGLHSISCNRAAASRRSREAVASSGDGASADRVSIR